MEEPSAKASGCEASEVRLTHPTLDFDAPHSSRGCANTAFGRKRLLDTQLVATYYAAGITRSAAYPQRRRFRRLWRVSSVAISPAKSHAPNPFPHE